MAQENPEHDLEGPEEEGEGSSCLGLLELGSLLSSQEGGRHCPALSCPHLARFLPTDSGPGSAFQPKTVSQTGHTGDFSLREGYSQMGLSSHSPVPASGGPTPQEEGTPGLISGGLCL